MNPGDLLSDDTIARMSDADFSAYWTALGQVVRIACRSQSHGPEPADPAPARQEINNTSASTERKWSPTVSIPAAPFGFTADVSRSRPAPPAPHAGAQAASPPTPPSTSAS